MDKILETTKSLVAAVVIIALVGISVIGVNSLNPVSNVVLNSTENQVAGVQDTKSSSGDIKIQQVSSELTFNSNKISFEIKPGATSYEVGEIRLKNMQNRDMYTLASAQMAGDLKNLVRIELIDDYNKILLSDFNKDFDNQKLSFKQNSERVFKIKYILAKPLNFVAPISITLQ